MESRELENWIFEDRMKDGWAGGHPAEEQIERYAMGNMAEPDLSVFEEHLILCPRCQQAVEAADSYVAAMRSALRTTAGMEAPEPAWRRWFQASWIPIPALGMAAAILLAAFLWRPPAPANWTTVHLEALRGAAVELAPAGSALRLELNAGGLSDGPAVAGVFDASGREQIARSIELKGAAAILEVPAGLSEGRYWVRIKSPQGETLREYGLTIK